MKTIAKKTYRLGGLTFLTVIMVAIGSFWQTNVLKVEASVQVLLVNKTAIPFGTIFPGEDLAETYTVALDTSINVATYTTTLSPISGLKDLCPLLEIKNIDTPAEPGDDFTESDLNRPADTIDKWQVRIKVPAIQGQVSQDHDGKIIVRGGDFGCKILIVTKIPRKPEVTFKKVGVADSNGRITYTLGYNVTGSGVLTGVVVTDTLPAFTTFVSATGGGTHSAGVVTWNLGNLTAPTSGSMQVVVDTFFNTFFDAVLAYQPGVSDSGTIRVLDATTNSPVLPNLEGASFPVNNLKDLLAVDGAFVNTSFTGNFGSGTQTKTVDDAAQTFVALGDGGAIGIQPSNPSSFILYNHAGPDFTIYETPNPGGKDPACVVAIGLDNTQYPTSMSSACGGNKAFKFQGTGDATGTGVAIDLTTLGVPANKQIKIIGIYDIKDGLILGTTGSPGYDLDALIARGPRSCKFENKSKLTATNLDSALTSNITTELEGCKNKDKDGHW